MTIRKYFQFSIMGEKEMRELKYWLWEYQLPFSPSYSRLSEAVYKYLYELRIEPRSIAQMERYLKSWSYQFESEFFEKNGENFGY